MSRHSNNTTSRPISTAGERAKIKDWGTVKAKVVTEAHKQFSHCTLCLCPAKDPHAWYAPASHSNHGHLFCRVCVFENLVTQKKENERLLKAFRAEQARLLLKQRKDAQAAKEKDLRSFEAATAVTTPAHQETKQILATPALVVGERAQARADLLASSYWCPENTPAREEQPMAKPKQSLLCPADRSHKIKLKELLALRFDAPEGRDQDFSCGACLGALKFQRVAALKTCGHVFCQKCLDKYSLKDGSCSICSKPCTATDVLRLEQARTGFAGHNEVEAVVSKPVFKY